MHQKLIFLAWFEILVDSDYQQYRIGFWSTRYDINPIISLDIGDGIPNMVDIGNIDIRNRWLLPIPVPVPVPVPVPRF